MTQPFDPPTSLPQPEPGAPVADVGITHAPAPDDAMQGWRRRHPSSPLINTIDNGYRIIRQAWPVVIVVALRGPTVFIGVVTAAVAVLAVWMVVSHLRFQYRLVGSELEVRSGVFTHQTRTLPVDRVQQVSLNQKLRHQLFKVVDVGIESAGSGNDAEIQLSVLTEADAELIRTRLTAARQQVGVEVADGELPPPVVVREPALLYAQPFRALFKWSLANSPLLMLIVVAPAFTTVGGAITDRVSDRFPTGVVGVSIALAFLALLALAVATAVNVIRYHDLRLTQSDDELRLRYGLLTQHQVDVPRERIQVLVEAVTIPGRAAGVVGITAHNASGTTGGTTTYLPAVPRDDRRDVTDLLAPGLTLHAPIARHPRAALQRAILRRLIPMALVAAVVIGAVRNVWVLAMLALPLLAIGFGWRSWTVLGHATTDDVVVGRAGVWGESTSYVRRDRVQSASVGASWTQRRRGLATLQIDVAQPLGNVRIRDMAAADAHRLLDELTQRR